MESASTLYGVPFRKNPRYGQKEVFDEVLSSKEKQLIISLPTGYGKTFVGCGAYAIKRKKGEVNRLLWLVSTRAQAEQFVKAGSRDIKDLGIEKPNVIDVGWFEIEAIRKHRRDENEVFVCMIHALTQSAGKTVRDMMASGGRWMVVVDEHHHYGDEKAWGAAVKSLPASFLLAMSATPHRKDNDGAFGKPSKVIKYRYAAEDERAIKILRGHSYVFRMDVIDQNGDIDVFTTSELAAMAGGCQPDRIDALLLSRKLRMSPKYVSPLVRAPIQRMIDTRLDNPGKRFQVLIKAMSVRVAEVVCEQVSTMFPGLEVNWVGTGEYGRSDEENDTVLKKFAPGRDSKGRVIEPEIDVLVQVGMAGEGVDSIRVIEIVFLTHAKLTNMDLQLIGRGSREDGDGVPCHVNFDSDSEFTQKGYLGSNIMDAMDLEDPQNEDEIEERERDDEYKDLPDWPEPEIADVTLAYIDSGEMREVGVALVQCAVGFKPEDIDDESSPLHEWIRREVLNQRRIEAREMNEKVRVVQASENVDLALSKITGLVIRMRHGKKARVEGKEAGNIKKLINGRKLKAVGQKTKGEDVCKRHYQWLKNLEGEILQNKELPPWLA